MKKLNSTIVFGLILSLLAACGKITVKGVDGTRFESYQECCDAQDFQAAHQFISEMEKNKLPGYEIRKAKKEVFMKEALFLMSQDDEDSQKRILYLIKEDKEYEENIPKLIDLAIDNNEDAFAILLIKQRGFKTDFENYLPMLVKSTEPEAANLIIGYLFEEMKRLRQAIPEGAIMKDYVIANNLTKKEIHSMAVNDAKQYNNLCDKILNLAIEYKKKDIANDIIDKYVAVPCGWEEGKRAVYSKDAGKKAREKIRQADFNI